MKVVDVRLMWALPTERDGGEPIAPAEIAGVKLEVKLKAAPDTEWSPVAVELPSVTERLLQGVPPGTYQARATVIGTRAGDDSDPRIIEFTVPAPVSKMGGVVGFAAEVLEVVI